LFASDDSFDFLLFYLIGGKWLFMAKEKADSRAHESKSVDAMLITGGANNLQIQ
jgi:hypothetical protein